MAHSCGMRDQKRVSPSRAVFGGAVVHGPSLIVTPGLVLVTISGHEVGHSRIAQWYSVCEMYHGSGMREVGDLSPVDVPEDLDRRLAGARVGQSRTFRGTLVKAVTTTVKEFRKLKLGIAAKSVVVCSIHQDA
eukprot:5714205-Pyramimonas_sp.AAC.1